MPLAWFGAEARMDAKEPVHGVDELFLNGLIGGSDGPGACQCEHDCRDEKLVLAHGGSVPRFASTAAHSGARFV